MRVLVLGAGGMGRVAAATAAAYPFVRSVLVGDRNHDSAARLAASIGAKAGAVQVDVSDPDAVSGLFRQVDIILNTVGPFYRFGVPVLKAAIQAGKHYADINDDWQPTLEMLALHERAQAAGITAVIGLGASPGISNMLALTAAHQLDSTDVLLTGWDALAAMDDPGALGHTPSAALIHWLHQTSGSIRLHSGGTQAEAQPLQELHFHYPAYGDAVVWTVGHPEPLTLPGTLSLQASANVMTGSRDLMTLLHRLRGSIDSGTLTLEAAAQAFLDQVLPQAQQPSVYAGARLPSLFAVAFGQKAGQPMTAAASLRVLPEGGMGGATGVPLALFAEFAHNGGLNKAGVYAPEAIFPSSAFFDLLARQITGSGTAAADLLEITTAPIVRLSQAQFA